MFKSVTTRKIQEQNTEIKTPKFMLVSLHKSGTHLVKKVLSEMGLEAVGVGKGATCKHLYDLSPGQYLWSHYPPSDEINIDIEMGEVKCIFNFRDPRDVLVSRFAWQGPDNERVTNQMREFMKKVYSHLSDDEFMEVLIRGEKFIESDFVLGEMFQLARGLLFHPNVLNVRFEELVGAKGGGTDELQRAQLESIVDYLGLEGIDFDQVAENAFDTETKTFNKGQIGGHKTALNKKQLELFNSLHSQILKDYGYE